MIPRTVCALFVSLLPAAAASAQDAVDLAASLIGRPYVWGAEGPNSFDCSGFTQYVYRDVGIDLPRRAVSQSTVGESTGRRLQRGDLVFFASDRRRSLVTHVGIYEGYGMMIDASQRHGRVRRDNLDDDYWIDRFMFAKRVTSETDRWEGVPDNRDRRAEGRSRPPTDRRAEAVRMLGRIGEILLRRSRR